eukprot:1279489-Amphidinium_carterae.1
MSLGGEQWQAVLAIETLRDCLRVFARGVLRKVQVSASFRAIEHANARQTVTLVSIDLPSSQSTCKPHNFESAKVRVALLESGPSKDAKESFVSVSDFRVTLLFIRGLGSACREVEWHERLWKNVSCICRALDRRTSCSSQVRVLNPLHMPSLTRWKRRIICEEAPKQQARKTEYACGLDTTASHFALSHCRVQTWQSCCIAFSFEDFMCILIYIYRYQSYCNDVAQQLRQSCALVGRFENHDISTSTNAYT